MPIKESLFKRVKRLFGRNDPRLYTARRKFKLRHDNVLPADVDAYMEKMLEDMKKVPYMDEKTGEYNLRFNLQDMVEDGYSQECNTVENAAAKKPDADVIVNQILAELSRISPYSQSLNIGFKMKSEWKGYIKVWLYPKIYYGKPSESQTDFSEIYAVEKDPSFLNWESIYYRDSDDHGAFDIYLNTLDKWDRYCSHYSGIWSVSWIDFITKSKKISIM